MAALTDREQRELEIVAGWPDVPWLDPIHVNGRVGERWYCRLCAAANAGRGVVELDQSERESHYAAKHARVMARIKPQAIPE